MKRFVTFLFILIPFALVPLGTGQNQMPVQASRVTLVTGENVELEDAEVITSGGNYFITFPFIRLNEAKAKAKVIQGYVYYFDDGLNSQQINELFDFKASDIVIDGIRVITGYTSSYSDFRMIEGKRVNVQVAITSESTIVGYPLILTGF